MAFTAEECRRIKLLYILETAGEAVLRYILRRGTDGKLDNVPLDEYLKGLPHSSTANFNKMTAKQLKRRLHDSKDSDSKMILKYVKEHPAGSDDLDNKMILKLVKERSAGSDDLKQMLKEVHTKVVNGQFNHTDQSQITSDPSCGAFDITLQYKAIKVACENVAKINEDKWIKKSSEMEFLVTKIKDRRNEVVHEKPAMSEQKYLTEVQKMEDVFYEALEATKKRYNRDDSELSAKKVEVSKAVDEVRKECVGIQEILERSAKKMLPDFKTETNKEIRDRLDGAKFLTPLHFLCDTANTQVEVHDVFSKIIVTREGKDEKMNHLKLMTLTQEGRSPKSPHLMMIEGDAGSGKTTLLTFLLAEWLKEEPRRSMEGLQHFDLLLWVVCHHETSTTVESFVDRVLHDASLKYRHLLLPLLKKCNIMIAVDGLDEVTESSRQLIADIMSHGKDCPTFTVVCTSRPEGLTHMKGIKPKNFKESHTRIEGIATEERTEFIVRHIGQLGVPEDTDHLRHVLQQIVWKETFRLPLNLLLLVYLYMEKHLDLTTRITQTKLYQDITDWSVEKLLHRMAGRPQGTLLKDNISNIMKLIYDVSLKELLHGNIHLSEESLSLMRSAWGDECKKEVLSAFFCLRRERTRIRTNEKYSAPHKGMQEYLAACSITGRLNKYKRGDIVRLLEKNIQGQYLDIPLLRNFFCHLLGILSSQENPEVMAIEEAVDLIHESEMEDTNHWLTVLADTEAGHDAMKRVAHHIPKETADHVTVDDGTVHVAASLLPLLHGKNINIHLRMDPVGVGDVLFPALANHTVKVLNLWHHFQHPPPPTASAHLLQDCPWSGLSQFIGHLHAEHLPLLPRGLEHLMLVVTGEEEAPVLLSKLQHVRSYCPRLKYLNIHVPVSSVAAASLSPLPHPAFDVDLLLSGVGDSEVEAACHIARAMCPRGTGYTAIRFPGASLDFGGYRRLLEGLGAAGVKVLLTVDVPYTAAITEVEEKELNTLTNTLLECFEGFVRCSEEDMWTWNYSVQTRIEKLIAVSLVTLLSEGISCAQQQ